MIHCPDCENGLKDGAPCEGKGLDCTCHIVLGVNVGEIVKNTDGLV